MCMSRKKPQPLKKLPLTDINLQVHMLRAHFKMLLWKAADQMYPSVDARDIRRFGWDVKECGVVTPYVSNAPVAPQWLLDVMGCSRSSERKASYRRRHLALSAVLEDILVAILDSGDRMAKQLQEWFLQPLIIHKKWY